MRDTKVGRSLLKVVTVLWVTLIFSPYATLAWSKGRDGTHQALQALGHRSTHSRAAACDAARGTRHCEYLTDALSLAVREASQCIANTLTDALSLAVRDGSGQVAESVAVADGESVARLGDDCCASRRPFP